MCFLRFSAVLLVAATFAVANPVFSGNYGGDNGFGGMTSGYLGGDYRSGSAYSAQNTRVVSRVSSQGSGSGYGNGGFDAVRGYGKRFGNNRNGFGGSGTVASLNYLRANGFANNEFSGVSGKRFKGFGSLSSVPGVLFAFPSLTSVSYTNVPEQNNDLATLAVLSVLLADSIGNDYDNYNDQNKAAVQQIVSHQTVTGATARNTGNNQVSNVAFIPVVNVPKQQKKTTEVVDTIIETDGAVSDASEFNPDLANILSEPESDFDSEPESDFDPELDSDFDSELDSFDPDSRSYSGASSSSSSRFGSSRIY